MKKNIFSIIILLTSLGSYSQYSISRIIPENATSIGFFGWSSSMHGNTIVAGSTPSVANKIYVFENSSSSVTQTAILQSPEANQSLGVAITQDDYIYIGSPSNNTNVANGGAVFVFKKINNVWTYITKIQPSNQNPDDRFGTSLAFENNQLFVGVNGYEAPLSPAGTNTGAIFVYDKSNDDFTLNQILSTTSNNALGSMIDIEQDVLISTNTNNANSTSNVVSYKKTGGVWSQISTHPFQYRSYDFTKRVNYTNNQLFVVESDEFMPSTTIKIYDLQPDNSWLQTNTLPGTINDYFSAAINVKNNNMLLSGFGGYMLQLSRKNTTTYYKKINGTWTYQASFTGQGPHTEDDTMGHDSFIADNTILIGNTYENWGELPLQSNGSLYKLDVTLGINDYENKSFSVYPNPASDRIHISSASNYVKEFQLSDLTGKILKTQNCDTSEVEISLDQIANGVYFLRITDSEGKITFKKIIKK